MKKARIILIVICSIIALSLIGFMVIVINDGGIHTGIQNRVFSNSPAKLLSDDSFDAQDIKEISVKFKGTPFDIYVKKSNNNQITIKQYLPDEKYLGTIVNKNGAITINGPTIENYSFVSFGFNSMGYIEVYIPDKDYQSMLIETSSGNLYFDTDIKSNNIDIHTTSGDIKGNADFKLSGQFQLETTSGESYLGDIEADKVRLSSTSGDINVNKITAETKISSTSGEISVSEQDGKYEASTTSGDIKILNSTGDCDIKSSSGTIKIESNEFSGDVQSTSGNITIMTDKITDDISLSASSGDIILEAPKDSSFKIKMSTSSGDIRTDFDNELSFNKRGNEATGTYGNNAKILIDIDTTSGSITFKLK